VCVEVRELAVLANDRRAPRGTASRNLYYPCCFRRLAITLLLRQVTLTMPRYTRSVPPTATCASGSQPQD
jgi:hypothetical protein